MLDIDEKYRKEIELSSQKIKIGNLPTDDFALETVSSLRFQTAGWEWKLSVFGLGLVIANETGA